MQTQSHRRGRNARAFRPLSLSVGAYVALLTLLAVTPIRAQTTESPPISVNGTPSGVVALERDNRVFVPIRGVFEKLGASVNYTAPGSIVARKNGSDLATLTLGSRAATVNGLARTQAVAPFSFHGRVMVPLRLVSEAAGATVAYAPNPRSISVNRAVGAAPQQLCSSWPA